MTRSGAQEAVNASAFITGAMYLYRKLVEPDAAAAPAAPPAGHPPAGPHGGVGPAGAAAPAQPLGVGGITTTNVSYGPQPRGVASIPTQLLGMGPVAPLPRFLVGWGFTYIVLALWAQASSAAGPFALLVALGAVLGNGPKVATDIQGQLDQRTSRGASLAAPDATPTVPVDYTGTGAGATPVIGSQPRRARPNTHSGRSGMVPAAPTQLA